MINILINFMVMTWYGVLHKAMKTAFMPAMTGLSCYGQQTISVDVVSKIAKPYLCPGSNNADRSYNQAAGHHSHHSKYMLNPTAYFCSRLIALLFPFGKLAVFAALALQSFAKSPLLKQAGGFLRPIGGISIYFSARVAFLQQLIKYSTVMYRGISHCIRADKLVLYVPFTWFLYP